MDASDEIVGLDDALMELSLHPNVQLAGYSHWVNKSAATLGSQ